MVLNSVSADGSKRRDAVRNDRPIALINAMARLGDNRNRICISALGDFRFNPEIVRVRDAMACQNKSCSEHSNPFHNHILRGFIEIRCVISFWCVHLF